VTPWCATRVTSHGASERAAEPWFVIVYSMTTTPASVTPKDFVTATPRARLGAPSNTTRSPEAFGV
jgi:hypothetical protein